MTKLEKLSKNELSEKLCDLFDIEVDFAKMTKEDLISLHRRFNELMEGIDDKLLSKPLKDILDIKIGGKPLKELALGDIIRRVRDHGPLGLGILPEIRREIRRVIRGETE